MTDTMIDDRWAGHGIDADRTREWLAKGFDADAAAGAAGPIDGGGEASGLSLGAMLASREFVTVGSVEKVHT